MFLNLPYAYSHTKGIAAKRFQNIAVVDQQYMLILFTGSAACSFLFWVRAIVLTIVCLLQLYRKDIADDCSV